MVSLLRKVVLPVLFLLAGIAVFLNVRTASSPNAAMVELTPEEQMAMLDSSLRALEDGVRDAPRDRWDPEYVVARVGRDPDSLHRWVQENTSWIPYRGVLRGPTGVLMDRQGNSLDRALLLADLLTRAGHSVRLARTEIPIERARAMLPDVAAIRPGRADLDQAPVNPVPVSESARAYGLDGKAVEQTLETYDEATADLLKRVEERVASQTKRLFETIDAIGPLQEWTSRADSALAMLRDHWWVQVETSGSWSDLDVVRRDSTGWEPMSAVSTISPPQVDASLYHRVTVRVVTERFTQGRLVEERVLDHALRPGDVIGKPIALQFWPSDWPALEATTGQTARSLRQLALEQDGWNAALVIGTEAVASAALDASAGAARHVSGIGGLGSAMANALAPRKDGEDGQLTASSIEFVIDVPGRMSRVIRRSVFDLIGPAARHAGVTALTLDEGQKLRRSLSLMMRTEILVLGAQPNADFVAHMGARNMLANAHLLRAVAQPGFGSDARMVDSLLKTAEPGVGPLYALGVLRHEAMSDAVFLDQATILTRHRFPHVVGDSVGLVDATDIVANEVGIALSESDGFMARLAQGTWDTNLEALLGLVGGPAGNAAVAFEESRNWLALTRDDKERLRELQLPADALARIGLDLENGYTVVVPQRPVTVDAHEFSAWWRIDRQTGDALGIGENGWGQAIDYGNLVKNVLIVGGRAFMFEYGLCQFIPQAANSLNIIGGEFWRLGLAPSWTRPPAPGKDFEDVAVENNRVCLRQAMQQGFLATAPLLLATARYVAITRVRSLARQQAAYEDGWKFAIARFRGAREFCLCTPREFRTGLLRAQVRGGPPIPEVDPFGRTQPARQPQDFSETQKGVRGPMTLPGLGSARPEGPYPTSLSQAEREYKAARDAYYAAADNASKHTGDWIRYRYETEYKMRQLNPDAPIPDFTHDNHHSFLEAKMNEAGTARDYELTKAIHAETRLEWAKDAANRQEIPRTDAASPPQGPTPCIANCSASSSGSASGSGPSSGSGAMAAGSSALNSFFQGRWPTGNR